MRATIGIVGLIFWMILPAILFAAMTGAIKLAPWVTGVLVIASIVAFGALASYLFPSMMYGDGLQGLSETIEEVQRSGHITFTASTAGALGGVRIKWPLLRVEIHPGGVIFRPAFLAPCGLLTSQIKSIHLSRRVVVKVVEIHHTSSEVESPVVVRDWFGIRQELQKLIPIE